LRGSEIGRHRKHEAGRKGDEGTQSAGTDRDNSISGPQIRDGASRGGHHPHAPIALFDEIPEAVTEKIRDLMQADRATLFLVDRQDKVLRSKIARGDGTKRLVLEVAAGRGIAGRVADTGRILNIPDPYAHPDFNPDVDRETGYRTESILAAPLRDQDREVFAVVQLLNREGGPFQPEDERIFADFADSLEAILETCIRVAPRSVGGLGPSGGSGAAEPA
jgi:hypothetical protein